jgi:hypothetical protein
VTRDGDGKPYTVRYEAVNAMLLNEFLKEHRTVQEQAVTITQQRRDSRQLLHNSRRKLKYLLRTYRK